MFLGGDELLGAWVALIGGEIVGHVALRAPSSDDEAVERVMALTGCSLDVVTKVARLFSDPARRGRGIGTALLDRATHYAHELRRRPLLDVETTSTIAIALYCSQGWEHVGSRVVTFSSGDAMVLETYLGPSFESGTGPGPTRRF